MRFVPIERVEHGMMLAKSIYDYETRTLLREGKLLSDEIIVRVRERGYPGIYIEDELTKDVVIQDAITAELRNHAGFRRGGKRCREHRKAVDGGKNHILRYVRPPYF